MEVVELTSVSLLRSEEVSFNTTKAILLGSDLPLQYLDHWTSLAFHLVPVAKREKGVTPEAAGGFQYARERYTTEIGKISNKMVGERGHSSCCCQLQVLVFEPMIVLCTVRFSLRYLLLVVLQYLWWRTTQ